MKQCKMLDLFDEYNKNRKNRLPTFMDLINCNDEFAFSYHGITYELINGDEEGKGMGCSLYLANSDKGTFLHSFASRKDFLDNAKIESKNIAEILNDIQV